MQVRGNHRLLTPLAVPLHARPHLVQQLHALVDELRTVADPDAAEAQIEAVTTDAAERITAASGLEQHPNGQWR